jgi:hypothetical protein
MVILTCSQGWHNQSHCVSAICTGSFEQGLHTRICAIGQLYKNASFNLASLASALKPQQSQGQYVVSTAHHALHWRAVRQTCLRGSSTKVLKSGICCSTGTCGRVSRQQEPSRKLNAQGARTAAIAHVSKNEACMYM